MHTLIIFFSILGGIGYFGILGVILGPLVFAIGLTFFELFMAKPQPEDRSEGNSGDSQGHLAS
jgi:predicted PurR-regulated permease PerM